MSAVNEIRDDRVLKSTHLLGAIIVPFLLVAFALLYVFRRTPGATSPESSSRR
jgi:hypothetical protein